MNGQDYQSMQQPLMPPEFQEAKRPIPWKAILIIGIALIVAIIIVVVVLIVGNRKEQQAAFERRLQIIQNQVVRQTDACLDDSNPEACRAAIVTEAVRGTGQVSLCEMLEGEEFDTCVWTAATEQQLPELCEQIADTTYRAMCSDSLYTSLQQCDRVTPGARQDICTTLRNQVTPENCRSTSTDVGECLTMEITEEAIRTRDLSVCDRLTDVEARGECEDKAEITDKDFDGIGASLEADYGSSDTDTDSDDDGLTDYDEIILYQSNPINSDTDGDGYPDGEEVQNGFDPKGPGSL